MIELFISGNRGLNGLFERAWAFSNKIRLAERSVQAGGIDMRLNCRPPREAAEGAGAK